MQECLISWKTYMFLKMCCLTFTKTKFTNTPGLFFYGPIYVRGEFLESLSSEPDYSGSNWYGSNFSLFSSLLCEIILAPAFCTKISQICTLNVSSYGRLSICSIYASAVQYLKSKVEVTQNGFSWRSLLLITF